MELFRKYDVYVISDEIWSDIILGTNHHTPTQSVSDDARNRVCAFYAPSKTFNLAGLIGSYHICYNSWWRDRLEKESSLCHYNSMNVLSMHALIGAYRPEGYVWTDELRQTLTGNIDFAVDYIEKHFPGISVSKPQGTYMLFVDCTDWCAAHGKTIDDVEQACWDVGVAIQDGRMFHGSCHIRMNLALPPPASRRPSAGWISTSSTQKYFFQPAAVSQRAVLREAPAKRDRLGAIGITPPETPTVFNPRSPVWGATGIVLIVGFHQVISIHAPPWGSDDQRKILRFILKISVHAPRVGSDSARRAGTIKFYILIHAPVWGATIWAILPVIFKNFNPRSPCGERHRGVYQRNQHEISIHAPRVGGHTSHTWDELHFNPRSPCGSDVVRSKRLNQDFNPRSPCGERPSSTMNSIFSS